MATHTAILPCINKNLSSVIDHNGSGLVAYGCRSTVYFLDLRTSPPIICDKQVIRNAHRGRVLSLSFSKAVKNEYLASLGEDKSMKIWSLTDCSMLNTVEVKECSRVVEWIYGSADSVVYPDTNGFICKWNFCTSKVLKAKTGSDILVTVLASNPKQPDIIAAGHSSGAISVMNVVNLVLLHKLRSHTMEIMSLSWSPVMPDVLLSTSQDMSARLWKLGSDNPINIYFYPTSRVKAEERKNVKVCGLCHPEDPDVVFCSNVRGDLGSVTFKENEAAKFTSISAKEWDNYKTVVAMLPYYDSDAKRHMFITSDHMKISLWDINERKIISSVPYTMGVIFELALSSIHPDLLAVCSGDGSLKVWKQNSEDKSLDVTSIYIHHRIKVMSVAWHPTEENILAYGVDEGRVGIADFHKKKSLYSFETHHSGTVYSLVWGPCPKIEGSEMFILVFN